MPPLVIDGRRLTATATGVGRYLRVLLNQWALAPGLLPFEPTVILHREGPGPADTWQTAFPHFRTGPRWPGWAWENFKLAAPKLRHQPLLAPANLVPHRWQGPVALVVHDTFCEHSDSGISTLNRLRFRARYRRAAQRADLVLTPSSATAHDVEHYFALSPDRIQIIPPGLPPQFQPAHLNGPELCGILNDINSPFVLFVGKKSKRRHFADILAAVERVRREGINMKLIAVGPKQSDQINPDFFQDLGYVNDEILVQLYQQATALVWPSHREGFGLPVAEAQACGCPVITTPRTALAEVAGQACLPIQEITALEMANSISALIKTPGLRQSLIEKGLEHSHKFSAVVFAEAMKQAISRITA